MVGRQGEGVIARGQVCLRLVPSHLGLKKVGNGGQNGVSLRVNRGKTDHPSFPQGH